MNLRPIRPEHRAFPLYVSFYGNSQVVHGAFLTNSVVRGPLMPGVIRRELEFQSLSGRFGRGAPGGGG